MAEKDLFEIIESKLDSVLRPVNPEEKYINNLNSRLFIEPRISIERNNAIKIFLFICLALITGFTFFLFINEIFSREKKQKVL